MAGTLRVTEASTTSAPRSAGWRLLFLFLLLGFQGFSQEICDNGIDDDGDNLVDVFDPDCPCDDQTLLCQPSCEYSVPGGPLNFTQQWSSNDTVPNYQTPLVADIDNDGVPEIVMMSSHSLVTSDPRRAKDLLIISGATGATELTISTPFMAWVGPNPVAIADIDGDGFGEIIIASIDHTDNAAGDRRYLYCYEHTGALKWKSNVQYGYTGTAIFGSALGITDFNSDGIAEVYVYNQIFNATTGVKLAEGGVVGGKAIMTSQSWGDVANPVAANLTTDPGLELACGNTVYNVTLTNTSGTAGNSMSPITIAGQSDGYTSLADIDLDGNLDVVVATEGSTGSIYVWNPGNGTPSLIASVSLPNTGGNWIGVPFIGDMDKDCQPEIGVTRSRRVYALDYDGSATLSFKWTLVTTDASGFTGITMFDFNQDGTQELVYRDESTLRILDASGSAPVTVGTNPCTSGTGAEMPVVADVDGDGQAEICVSCAISGVSLGKINVFSASGQAWAPCRSIWNQYNYFNVNINNNLSIPLQQQQHQVMLSNVTCPFFTCSENRPFNSFLSQATFLTQEGCPVYPASDISLSIQNSVCNGSAEYDLSLLIENVGAAPSDSGYPIRFYAGNPFTSAATPIAVLSGPSSTQLALNPGDTETLNYSLDIAALPKPFNLFVVLNDDGTSTAPFNFPLSTLPECNFADNVASISNINCCPFGDLAISGFTPASATFCQGGSSSLTVSASSSAGLTSAVTTWTFPDNSIITADSILADQGGTYLVTVKDNAQCSVSSSINITETPQPTTSAAGADQSICSDSTALEGNIPSVGSGNWTLVSGSGIIANPTSATSNLSGIAIGTSTFAWTILNGADCISSDTVSITRIDPPSSALAGSDQTVCVDVITLAGTDPAIGVGAWSLVSGSGVITDANSSSSTVTALVVGTNVFQWTISNGVCPTTSDQVTITRSPEPSLADAGSNQTVCSPNAVLSGATLISGTGTWSLISGTGTISDVNDPTSSISGLSLGANVFEWTVTSGACAASTDQVQITVSEVPSPAVTGNDQEICATTTTLSATAPLVGNGAWTLMSGSGTIADAFSASTSVSNLGPGANVFQWIVSNSVCLPNTALLVVTRDLPPDVAVAGNDQQVCDSAASILANTPAVGTGVWSIISGSGTLSDANAEASSISGMTPGTTVLEWTISNGVCPSSSDQLSIVVDAVVSTPDAGSDFSICSSSTNLNATAPTIGTGQWSIISGSGSVDDPSNPTSGLSNVTVGSTVLRWTVSNGTCSDFDEVTVTRTDVPDAASVGTNQNVCSSTAVLSATAVSTGTGTWSVISGTATFTNANDPTDQVSDLSVGVNQLLWTVSNGVCPVNTDTLVITVDANPVIPDAGEDQELCADASTLSATAASVGTGAWSVISGSVSIANVNDPQSAISAIAAGANVLRWTITNGACVAFDQVTITRDLPPSAAIAGQDQSICLGQAFNLDAAPASSGTGAWTILSGQATLADSTLYNTAVSGAQAGTLLLEWTISSGVCASTSDQVTITIADNNLSALAGANQTICDDSTQLAATLPSVGTGTWSLVSGTGILVDANDPATAVSGLGTGANVFRWTVSNGACTPVTADVTIQVDTPPSAASAGIDQIICSDNTQLAAELPSNGTGTWSLVTGAVVFADVQSASSAITSIGVGINVLQWSISNGVCPAVNDQIIITRDSLPVQANAGVDISICNSDTLSLQATEPTPGTGLWTVLSGTGVFEDATDPITNVSGLSLGSTQFIWTVTTGNCPSTSDTLSITNDQLPQAATAGSDTSLCGTTSVLNASVPSVGTGAWVSFGTAVFDDINAASTNVSNLQPGINTLAWVISNGNCPTVSDTVVLTVDKNPITPNAGPDVSICADTTTLSAAAPSTGTGQWSLISGTASITDVNSPTSTLTGIGTGTTVLRWTVTSGACIVFDEMSILRSEPPSVSVAGSDQQLCDSVAVLDATAPAIGTGVWTIVSGTAIIADVNDPASSVSGLAPGETILAWTVSNGACEASESEVTLFRDIQPAVAVAGEDQSICADTTHLAASASSGGIWTLISGTAVIANADSATTAISGLGVGTTVFRWTLPASGSCPAVWDEVSIVRNAPTSLAFAGNDTTVCASSITLNANTPANGTGVWLVISGNAQVQDTLSTSTLVTQLEIGANVFEWRISNGTCPVETDEVTITLSDTASAGVDQSICADSALLSATGIGSWSLISGSGTFANADTAITHVTGLAAGANVFQWTINGGACPTSNDQVTITVSTPPTSAQAGPDAGVCSDGYTLAAVQPSIGTGVWYVLQGAAVLSDSSSATSTLSGLSVGVNSFEWQVSNGTCPVVSDTIIITRGDTAYAGADQVVCDSSATLSALVPSNGTGEWTLISGSGIIVDSSDANSSVSGLSAGENVFQWTVSGAACPDSTDQVIITRSCNTPPIITNDSLSLEEDSVLTSTLLDANDYDPDNTNLTVDTTSVTGPNHGTVVIHPDGSFTYTPDENYTGLDTFIVAVCDSGAPLPVLCGQDTVVIFVSPINDPPVIVNDTVTVIPGGTVTDNLLDNDSDIEGTELTVNTNPLTSPSNGTITVNADGSFTYTPDVGFTGTDTVVVEVCDNGIPLPIACAPDTIFIVVEGTLPIANAGSDLEICGTFVQLNATPAEAPATGQWTIASGSCLIVEQNVYNTNIVNIASDTVLLVWTVTLNGITASDTVQVIAHEAATTAFAGEDQIICGSSAELLGTTAVNGTGTWSLVNGSGLISNTNAASTGVNGLQVGTSTFAWTINNGFCVSSDTVEVQSLAATAVSISTSDTSICPLVNQIQLNATVQGGLSGQWSVSSGTANFSNDTLAQTLVSGLAEGENVLVYGISNGPCSSSDSVIVTVLPDDADACVVKDIFIPEGFSPDGDGANDQLVIYGLNGKHVSLKVFNRWGNLVYESDNYQNNWDGTCTTGFVLTGERLPESTYYYIVQIEGENESRKGFLTLWR